MTLVACLSIGSACDVSIEWGSDVIRHEIEAVNEGLRKAIEEGKAGAAASFFTKDAELMPPQAESVSGRTAIREFWQGAFDAGMTSRSFETVEFDGDSSSGYEVGYYLVRAGELVVEEGRYLVLWKKEDGMWKRHKDMWNTERPDEVVEAPADSSMTPADSLEG